MKGFYTILLFIYVTASPFAFAQVHKVDEVKFFEAETPLNVTLVFDMRRLMNNKFQEGMVLPATFISRLSDSQDVKERIRMEVRGHFRRENCDMPPLRLRFKNTTAPILSPLGTLKLVNICDLNNKNRNEYLLREYLVYKLYNLITDKSYRVRLLQVNFEDSIGKRKTISSYAFLMEDDNDLARRNKAVEVRRRVLHSEATDRYQMTIVAIFQYMIGNTDWSVPAKHNIKLLAPKSDTNAIPIPVPYDFDHAGLVSTDYALPPPGLPIESVKERLYRGFPRTKEELDVVLALFQEKKDAIYSTINNFSLLSAYSRKEMIRFLDDFYDLIKKPNAVNSTFILNARKN